MEDTPKYYYYIFFIIINIILLMHLCAFLERDTSQCCVAASPLIIFHFSKTCSWFSKNGKYWSPFTGNGRWGALLSDFAKEEMKKRCYEAGLWKAKEAKSGLSLWCRPSFYKTAATKDWPVAKCYMLGLMLTDWGSWLHAGLMKLMKF